MKKAVAVVAVAAMLAACGGREEKSEFEAQDPGNSVAVGDTAASPPMVATDTSTSTKDAPLNPTATSTMPPPASGTGEVEAPTTTLTAEQTSTAATSTR